MGCGIIKSESGILFKRKDIIYYHMFFDFDWYKKSGQQRCGGIALYAF